MDSTARNGRRHNIAETPARDRGRRAAGDGWEWRFEKRSNVIALYEDGRWRYEVDLDRFDLTRADSIVEILGHLAEKELMLDHARLGGFVRLAAQRTANFTRARFG